MIIHPSEVYKDDKDNSIINNSKFDYEIKWANS